MQPTATERQVGRRTAQDRRETIIAAARTLFAKNGFHGAGMAEIARVSNVRVGQIYRDFAGKEDLIAAIVERDVTELLDDPHMASALDAGHVEQLNTWVRGFVSRDLDRETCSILADIMSEATRNARMATIVAGAHERLHARLTEAAMLWAPAPEKAAARKELADFILTAAGAIQHRQIFGLEANAPMIKMMVELVETEIARLGS